MLIHMWINKFVRHHPNSPAMREPPRSCCARSLLQDLPWRKPKLAIYFYVGPVNVAGINGDKQKLALQPYILVIVPVLYVVGLDFSKPVAAAKFCWWPTHGSNGPPVKRALQVSHSNSVARCNAPQRSPKWAQYPDAVLDTQDFLWWYCYLTHLLTLCPIYGQTGHPGKLGVQQHLGIWRIQCSIRLKKQRFLRISRQLSRFQLFGAFKKHSLVDVNLKSAFVINPVTSLHEPRFLQDRNHLKKLYYRAPRIYWNPKFWGKYHLPGLFYS